jgi:hypothetical protein
LTNNQTTEVKKNYPRIVKIAITNEQFASVENFTLIFGKHWIGTKMICYRCSNEGRKMTLGKTGILWPALLT